MLVVDRLAVDPQPGPRLVWGGRFGETVPGALDGWSTGRAGLLRSLDAAGELLLLDPMSFPWESLRPTDRDVPLVVVLPRDLDAEALSETLGPPLLSSLTSADRVVEPRPEVRQSLARRWRLDDEVWLDEIPEASESPHTRADKNVWLAVRSAVTDSVRQHLAEAGIDLRRISVVSTDSQLAGAVGVDLGLDVRHVDPEDDERPHPLDQVAVLVLPPGTRSPDRVRLLERTHRRLRSAGLLVLVATVVASVEDPPDTVPSTDDLVEELQLATGTAVHVHDLRSLRWASEPLVRGVLVAATSLSVPVPG